ncbi:MAG: FliH/SctL family protein [Deltaproteobacteria bacterium]|nr:FliH/SctL family protein [Deltaproteobacteria bacterium]
MDDFLIDEQYSKKIIHDFQPDFSRDFSEDFVGDYRDRQPTETELLQNRIKQLESEIELAREEGRSEGYLKCIEDQQEEIEQTKKHLGERFETVLHDYLHQVVLLKEELEEKMTLLAIRLAEKLILQAVQFNCEAVLAFMKETVNLTKVLSVQKVRVSPEDFEFIQFINLGKIQPLQSVEIVADPTIRSGCIVETTSGNIEMLPLDRLVDLKNSLFKETNVKS